MNSYISNRIEEEEIETVRLRKIQSQKIEEEKKKKR
jgi:hypothetical protein